MLRYAQVLQSNGKCEDATRWYRLFNNKASRKEKRNRELVIDCDALKRIKNHDKVVLENLQKLNTPHLDFSPIPFRDGIIFTSTRDNSRPEDVVDSWTNDNFSDLYYSEFDEELHIYKNPKALKGDLNKKFHDGVATFNQSGTVMFFTRNNDDSKSKDGMIDLKVYSAFLTDDGYWTGITELPFNSNEFATCHPTLSPDGMRLYFSSNRPGGYGGLDIYVSEKKGGMWHTPQNLGSIVNSAGNELFPVMHSDETLYYSSNGHRGLGGLDIFYAKKMFIEDEYSWATRENLGTPFNSLKDDFGFVIMDGENENGFLTSNREGGVGKDDIYIWSVKGEFVEEGPLAKSICVFNEKTGETISNAHVTISEVIEEGDEENNGDMMLTLEPLDENEDKFILGITGKDKKEKKISVSNYETNESGTFTHTAIPDKNYKIKVEKDGYNNQTIEVSYQRLKNEREFCLSMTKRNCKIVSTTVVNKKYNSVLPETEVEVWNKCTNQKDKYTTDETGAFEICVPCGCEFRIIASKSGFDSDTELVSTLDSICDSEQNVELKMELTLREMPTSGVVKSNPVSNQNGSITVPVTTYEEVITYVPKKELVPVTTYVPISEVVKNENVTISEGQIISLKDIYYNFDKSDIREDASIDLNHVYTLLQKYPSMEIELMSHTDSRGTSEYNSKLSGERARSARQFLLRRGISAERIVAKGYGESQLKNNCADGVDCSKSEHQQNRRTEIKVIKFDEKHVKLN